MATTSSANMSSLTSLVAITLTLVSGYATYQSTASILNIKKYEDKAKRAAEWSNTAKQRLWDTRYTIGAGFVSVRHFQPRSRHRSDLLGLIRELMKNTVPSLPLHRHSVHLHFLRA